ncbi:MAG: arabinose isomerase [Phycisphaerae bacterium]
MSTCLKIGLFGTGIHSAGPRSASLAERLPQEVATLARSLGNVAKDVEVVNLGLIDTPEKALNAGHAFRQADVDLLVIHLAGNTPASAILPAARRANVPVLLLNLQSAVTFDNDSTRPQNQDPRAAAWPAHAAASALSEATTLFTRAGLPVHPVTGMLENDEVAWEQITDWLHAAKAAHTLEHHRLGVMATSPAALLDAPADLAAHRIAFGTHFEPLEFDEFASLREKASREEVTSRIADFRDRFDLHPDLSPDDLARAARNSIALDRLADDRRLGALACHLKPALAEDGSFLLAHSLLTARNIPVAGRLDIPAAHAMKILDTFNAGGAFTECFSIDYNEDLLLMGHDGPIHPALAQAKPRVRLAAAPDKSARRMTLDMPLKTGPVTLLSLTQTTTGQLQFLFAEGESVRGPQPDVGHTLGRYRFWTGARQFLTQWNAHAPSPHFALGTGHLASKIEKLAALLHLPVTRVC